MWTDRIAGLARDAGETFQRNPWLQGIVAAVVFPNLFVAGYLGAFDSRLSVLADGTLAFLLRDASSRLAVAIILVSLVTATIYWLLPLTERRLIRYRPYRRLRRSWLKNATWWRAAAVVIVFMSSWFNLWVGVFLFLGYGLFLLRRLVLLKRAIRQIAHDPTASAALPGPRLDRDTSRTLSSTGLRRAYDEALKARETNRAALRASRLRVNRHIRSRARRAALWPVTLTGTLAVLVYLGGWMHAEDVRDAPEFEFSGPPASLISPSRSGVLIWDFDRKVVRNIPVDQMIFTGLTL
ncbi:MAG: hypothetical protein ABNH26_08310 [Celeribacter sp.]|jgi:hypothetical protein